MHRVKICPSGGIDMAVSKNNDRIMITLPKDVKAQLESMAAADNRSISNYILTIIQKHLKEGR
jgi:predicted DNA-binding protein